MARAGGNPNIREISKKSTGPRTDKGKLRMLVSQGWEFKNSKLLEKFRKCDKCPLRARVETRIINNKAVQMSIPARCLSYKPGGKCTFTQAQFASKLDMYFKIGEELNTLELQKSLAYAMIEDAETAREAEMLEKRRPGFYTHKYRESAINALSEYNKTVYGERIHTTNVNVDLTTAILKAYGKRMRDENK